MLKWIIVVRILPIQYSRYAPVINLMANGRAKVQIL